MTNNGHPNNVEKNADRFGLGMIESKDFFGEVNEALSSFTRSVDMLRKTLPIIIKVVVSNGCPNKRVAYLAFYARKKRARKKNLKRALKEIRYEHIRNNERMKIMTEREMLEAESNLKFFPETPERI